MTFALLQIYTSINPVGYVQTQSQKISNFMTGIDIFNPLTGLDVAGSSPAPAIACTITNNVHIIGTDGSTYTLNSATDYFSPVYNSVVNAYNNVPVDHIDVRVYLYCKASTLSQYGYYPYLTGGTINVEFKSTDVSNTKQHAWGYNQNVNAGEPNGASMLIAEFNEPVSAINTVANTASVDYTSLQDITTTGNLIFKQKLSQNTQATYTLTPLHTYFGFLIQNPTGTQQKTSQYINMISPNQAQQFTLDKHNSKTISVNVGVEQYNTKVENPPVISIYKQVLGITDSNNPIKDYTLPATPNGNANSDYSQWTFPIDVSSLPVGTYEIGLHGQTFTNTLFNNNVQSRPWVHTVFQIVDTTPALTPTSSSGGGSGNNTSGGNLPPYCSVTQVLNGYTFDGKQCNANGLKLPDLNSALSNLQSSGPTIGIVVVIGLIALVATHHTKKYYTGTGIYPSPQQMA